MENKTAVEWLVEQVFDTYTGPWKITIEKALKMEKEQMKEMYKKGIDNYELIFKIK